MSDEVHIDSSVGIEAANASDEGSSAQSSAPRPGKICQSEDQIPEPPVAVGGMAMPGSFSPPELFAGHTHLNGFVDRKTNSLSYTASAIGTQDHELNNFFGNGDVPHEHQSSQVNDAHPTHSSRYTPDVPQSGNSYKGLRQSQTEPQPGLKRSMTSIVLRPGEKWTFAKAARLIMLRSRIIRTFSSNLKPYKHICKICEKLELRQNKFIISYQKSDRRQQAYSLLSATDPSRNSAAGPFGLGSNRHNLGNLRSIGERSERCPFCKLVIHSLKDLKLNAVHEENIKKCEDDNKKLLEDIRKYDAEIRSCETEVTKEWEEHAKSHSEPRMTSEVSREEFVTRLNAYGAIAQKVNGYHEIIRKRKDEIKKCEEDMQKNDEDIDQYNEEIKIFGNQIESAVCYASFQMDGREVERAESGDVVDSRPRTRRIELRWSDPALQNSYIVLVAPEPGRGYDNDQRHLWELDTLFLARSIRSANKNQALIKSWVDLCRDHHGKPCNLDPGEDFHHLISKAFFGVIDVAEMRLTSLPPGSRYVALSYTWGQQTIYTTDLSNIQLHQEYGGLEKQFAHLPKVIRDTIQLVRSLGERYLWVDSLCIVQKNDVSWNLNSSVMDLVYGNAYVTICAAEGEGAQMGLRGLDPKRKVSQNIEECAEGLRLTVSHLAETYIEKSRWNTRGWTFQERLLSRRCIIFVGDRVFFQCRSTALSEDIIGEQETAGWSIELVRAPLQMLLDIGNKSFSVYTECVRLYSKRDLGDRRDILAAFRGMSNLIGKEMGAPLHFALPTSHFDLALLWSPTSSCQRRIPRDDKERENFGDMKFPSWSWCGWSDSAIEYRKEVIEGCLANVNQWLTEHTWIRWYVRDGEGDLRPIWNKSQTRDRNDETYVETRWLGYGYNPDTRCDNYGRILKKEYLQHESKPLESTKFRRRLLEYPFGISEANARAGATHTYSDQPYLQFWTWSAHLRVNRRSDPLSLDDRASADVQGPGPGLVRCDIVDYCGDWCGTIVLNSDWFDGWYKNHQEEKSVHEFIAISEAKNFSKEESDMWTYYVPREREQAEWHLFYVLLVTRQGGIYQREGLGKVFKEAFAKSYLPGKEWKEIIMG